MTITIATAECFTHGLIAREIHAHSQGYQGELRPKFFKDMKTDTQLLCGIFIPSVSALMSILNIKPPKPLRLINGVKVYDEQTDRKVSVLMARGVKELTGADVGIGTSAGIGRGGISIMTDKIIITDTSDFYADLSNPNTSEILKRQKSGVEKTLKILSAVVSLKKNI